MIEIKFQMTKTGQRRAYYWGHWAMQWLPIKLKEAQTMIATGKAVDTTALPKNPS